MDELFPGVEMFGFTLNEVTLCVGPASGEPRPDAFKDAQAEKFADANALTPSFRKQLRTPDGFPMFVAIGAMPPIAVNWEPVSISGLLWIYRGSTLETVSLLIPRIASELEQPLWDALRRLLFNLFRIATVEPIIAKLAVQQRPLLVNLSCKPAGTNDLAVQTACGCFASAFLTRHIADDP